MNLHFFNVTTHLKVFSSSTLHVQEGHLFSRHTLVSHLLSLVHFLSLHSMGRMFTPRDGECNRVYSDDYIIRPGETDFLEHLTFAIVPSPVPPCSGSCSIGGSFLYLPESALLPAVRIVGQNTTNLTVELIDRFRFNFGVTTVTMTQLVRQLLICTDFLINL